MITRKELSAYVKRTSYGLLGRTHVRYSPNGQYVWYAFYLAKKARPSCVFNLDISGQLFRCAGIDDFTIEVRFSCVDGKTAKIAEGCYCRFECAEVTARDTGGIISSFRAPPRSVVGTTSIIWQDKPCITMTYCCGHTTDFIYTRQRAKGRAAIITAFGMTCRWAEVMNYADEHAIEDR